MNNQWNRIVYRAWAPVYDQIFNKGPFVKARAQVFESLPFHNGQKVLFVGVGTGADFAYIPVDQLDIDAIDYSPEMLEKARGRFSNSRIKFLEMDAQQLEFATESYDYVIGSLILSVVPDSEKAFAEMVRVLKPGGKLVIFDKFAKSGQDLSFVKKILRPLVALFGTDIGIRFEKLSTSQRGVLESIVDEPVIFKGMYRKIVLSKNN